MSVFIKFLLLCFNFEIFSLTAAMTAMSVVTVNSCS